MRAEGAAGAALLVLSLAGGAQAADEAADAWAWSGLLKADALRTSSPAHGAGLFQFNLATERSAPFGWADTTLHVEWLANGGGKPNRHAGSVQGIDNIEVAESAVRWYATWVEHGFDGGGTKLLFGLYDLNSEFYANDAAALLVHPSFGIGVDFSQSGRNGPSIFPNLGLALRLKQAIGSDGYLLAAVIDGVPGDPAHPGRTTLTLSRDDGALLVAEAGRQARSDDGAPAAHWGIGAWHYTARSERRDGGPPEHTQGLYALAQGALAPRTTGFVRAGVASRRVNAVGHAFDAGVLVDRPFGAAGPAAFTAGVAHAALAGLPAETAFEAGLRWQLAPRVALQPLVQHVRHPGGRAGSTGVVGLRLEAGFGGP